jgi:hypothetical protein
MLRRAHKVENGAAASIPAQLTTCGSVPVAASIAWIYTQQQRMWTMWLCGIVDFASHLVLAG